MKKLTFCIILFCTIYSYSQGGSRHYSSSPNLTKSETLSYIKDLLESQPAYSGVTINLRLNYNKLVFVYNGEQSTICNYYNFNKTSFGYEDLTLYYLVYESDTDGYQLILGGVCVKFILENKSSAKKLVNALHHLRKFAKDDPFND